MISITCSGRRSRPRRPGSSGCAFRSTTVSRATSQPGTMRISWTRHSSTQKRSSSDSCSMRRGVIARRLLRFQCRSRSCSSTVCCSMACNPLYQRATRPLVRNVRSGCDQLFAHRIDKRSPGSGGRNQVHLAVERPLSPLLAYAVTHDHARHVAVSTPVQLVGPAIDHGNADDLHIEKLRLSIQAGHIPDECIAPAPRPLGILGEHLPHLLEATLGMELHELPL